ncbi:hypothetical protein BSKO_05293 [Bryopsis sp. KO-2023]|nr:hypothetical protein BSKO_05293 [Bryopsis sp. KO-2023]
MAAIPQHWPWAGGRLSGIGRKILRIVLSKKLNFEKAAVEDMLLQKESDILKMEASIETLSLEFTTAKQQAIFQTQQYRRVVSNLEEELSNAENRIANLKRKLKNRQRKAQEMAFESTKCSLQLQGAKLEANKEAGRQNRELELKKLQSIALQKSRENTEAQQSMVDAEKIHKEKLDEMCKQHSAFLAAFKQKQAIEMHKAQHKGAKSLQRHQVHTSGIETIQKESDCTNR